MRLALDRLAVVKEQMSLREPPSLREVSFAAVPAWREAWEAAKAAGHMGPMEAASRKLAGVAGAGSGSG